MKYVNTAFLLVASLLFMIIPIRFSVKASPSLQAQPGDVIVFYFGEDNSYATCASIRPDGTDFHVIATADEKTFIFDPSYPVCSPGDYGILSPNQSSWLQYFDYDRFEGVSDYSVLTGNQLEIRQAGDTNPIVLLTGLPPNIFFPFSVPSWTLDSQFVLYWKNQVTDFLKSESEGEFLGDLLKIDAHSAQVTTLASFHEGMSQPVWKISREGYKIMGMSPDGSSVLFYSRKDSGSARDLYAVHTDGSGVVNLTNTPDVNEGGQFDYTDMSADWSPDGHRIAFASYASGVATVTASSANARSEPRKNASVVNAFTRGTQLNILAAQNGFVKVLNEQGQEVWVSTSVLSIQGGGTTVDVMNADGSERISLESGFEPAWSPDGQYLAFDCGALCIADTKNFKTIIQARGFGPFFWSPDSTQIAFVNLNPQDQQLAELHMFDIAAQKDNVLVSQKVGFTTFSDIQWASDGHELIFRACEPVSGGCGKHTYYICGTESCIQLDDIAGNLVGGSKKTYFGGAHWVPENAIQ